MNFLCAVLAVLSIWDYPSRFQTHEYLRKQFTMAAREGNTATMEDASRKGIKLLPDDPTWHYNLACSLAYFSNREEEAFKELETAIDLGFRNADAIKADTDLKRLEKFPRYQELLDYAREMRNRPMMLGPMATVDATGIFGKSIVLGEQNMKWNFEYGCFEARLKLARAKAEGNTGDLYMNRDGMHSVLKVEDFPGLTSIKLDKAGRERYMDLVYPNTLFPYPVFGNCSRAYTSGPYWRSLPRSAMTMDCRFMKMFSRMYLANQIWVFPACDDVQPVGTNGDVFASIMPYWLVTTGRSYSDQPYLRAALEASRSFKSSVKGELIRRGLLAPTIMTLIRKSLSGVTNETEYLSAKAHPTALPANGVELARLKTQAAAMTINEIPPLAVISVTTPKIEKQPSWPELTYMSAFAWAYVLRADEIQREFVIQAKGAKEYKFVQTHGEGIKVEIDQFAADKARVKIDRTGMSPTNRVDIAVFGRNPGTQWGAPSYVSFARMDDRAPYSDPFLTTPSESAEK